MSRTSNCLSSVGLFASGKIRKRTGTVLHRDRLRCRPALTELEDRRLLSLTTLASFNANTTGSDPEASLIMDSSGDLYGTASELGGGSNGTVFELAKGSDTITALAAFNVANGYAPTGSLIVDSSGNLYGTAEGGPTGDGTVFKLAKGSHTITNLAGFDGTDGSGPYGGLIMDSSGNLYGTTSAGSASGHGTVFELAEGSHTITPLASFDGTNGSNPNGSLIVVSSGNLYGTTVAGGASGDGTVFELPKGSHTITALASFTGSNGMYPHAGLVMDSSGNLYGATIEGGASGDGTVFELAKGSDTITALASFDGTNGNASWSDLIMDNSGNLYGTTVRGGASNLGTVFELAEGSHTITALASFNGTNGALPVWRFDHEQQWRSVRHNVWGRRCG